MKKLALLAPANVMHTVRWANAMIDRGIEVHLITCHKPDSALSSQVKLHLLKFGAPLGYFFNKNQVRKLLAKIKPDIVNAHFASGYGTLGRAVEGKYPYLLSVWGNDVYEFPQRSRWHRWFLKKNLLEATQLASTSHAMAEVTKKLTQSRAIHITPFGIDENHFKPIENGVSNKDSLVIGTVKTLKPKYGIDTLIEAFALVVDKWKGNKKLKLVIAGGGPQLQELKSLATDLNLIDKINFVRQVPHNEVASVLNSFDVYVALSRFDSESFGVAILEASACELPVVVSDTDGPAEVTLADKTGFIVPRENPKLAADAILKLLSDENLRRLMGTTGRKHVQENYTWSKSVDLMLKAYQATCEAHTK